MEEILASIRRIIADDDRAKPPAMGAEPAPMPEPAPLAPPRPATLPPRMVSAAPVRPPPPIRPAEPVMRQEEIDAVLARREAQSAPDPIEEPASDILDLTEQMAAPAPAATPAFRTIDGQPDVVFDEVAAPEPPPPPSPPVHEPVERALISSATTAAVDSAFNTLAQTVLVQNGRTLEDLVREMLRPMLKSWLDDNLPGMVERLVRAEIERVSRGRTS
jgi:cell pole-organizing protein PopZ